MEKLLAALNRQETFTKVQIDQSPKLLKAFVGNAKKQTKMAF